MPIIFVLQGAPEGRYPEEVCHICQAKAALRHLNVRLPFHAFCQSRPEDVVLAEHKHACIEAREL